MHTTERKSVAANHGAFWNQRLRAQTATSSPQFAIDIAIQLQHAVGYHDLPGSTVACLVLNYEDQKQEKIAIKYQEHVLDWWDVNKDKVTGKNSEVAWTGSTSMAEAGNARLQRDPVEQVNGIPARR